MGGVIEICYLQFMTGENAQYAWMKHWNQVATAQTVAAIKELGAEGLVLSTDLGQQGMMMPPDGIENAIAALKGAGITQDQIDTMMKKNPARLLGLAN
jgi:predicted metal-dependent phosphotriesterase family hydrolase